MDVFDRIQEDHDAYRDLLAKALEMAEGNPEKSVELYRGIYREITAHHVTEEHTVFPPLQQHSETKDITEEFFEEHEAIDAFLAYVRKSDKSVRWKAKMGVLKELVEHHLDEEEDEMFESGRKVLLEAELTGLVAQFDTMKNEELAKLE